MGYFQAEGPTELGGIVRCEGVAVHKLVYVEAVALVGRHSSGGGVGLFEIAHGDKLCHFVPQGCRGDPKIVFSRKGF